MNRISLSQAREVFFSSEAQYVSQEQSFIYYDDFSEDNWTERYQYRIFAYNDKTETLRFIYVSRNIKDPVNSANKISPHYLKLDW